MDVERLRRLRALAVERGDLNVVREIDGYVRSVGVTLETAEPPALEHAVPVMRRGPGRPPKEAT